MKQQCRLDLKLTADSIALKFSVIFTALLHVMQRVYFQGLSVHPSVYPSVKCVLCDKVKESSAHILMPH